MIYNGNLDKSTNQRKAMRDLRMDLSKWERERKGKRNAVHDIDAYQVRKEQDCLLRYSIFVQKAHKAEFAQLVEAARPKRTMHAMPMPDTTSAADDTIVVDSEEERLLVSS